MHASKVHENARGVKLVEKSIGTEDSEMLEYLID